MSYDPHRYLTANGKDTCRGIGSNRMGCKVPKQNRVEVWPQPGCKGSPDVRRNRRVTYQGCPLGRTRGEASNGLEV